MPTRVRCHADYSRQECPTGTEMGLLSIEVPEKNKDSEKLHSDTFPSFAAKAILVISESSG